jgi:hypothetical protein
MSLKIRLWQILCKHVTALVHTCFPSYDQYSFSFQLSKVVLSCLNVTCSANHTKSSHQVHGTFVFHFKDHWKFHLKLAPVSASHTSCIVRCLWPQTVPLRSPKLQLSSAFCSAAPPAPLTGTYYFRSHFIRILHKIRIRPSQDYQIKIGITINFLIWLKLEPSLLCGHAIFRYSEHCLHMCSRDTQGHKYR